MSALRVRSWQIVVNCVHEFLDARQTSWSIDVGGLSKPGAFRAEPLMMGISSPGNLVVGQSLADFHLNQLQQLFVVDLIALVQEYNNGGNTDLTGQQQMLLGLQP